MKTSSPPFKFKGLRFLTLVAISYVSLGLTHSEQAMQSLMRAGQILGQILPIIALVVVINALINWWLPPNKMVRLFKKHGAKRGWGIAMVAGVMSHGPMYLWYPMLSDLQRGGVPQSILVTYFYARAVKLPLLPLMVDYFGVLFTVTLEVYILIAAWLQGLVMQFLDRHHRGVTADAEDCR
ncbi:MAG: permease [Desulfuromonas sp.]|nr:MAG: permease [Desulfuromonas sp.]